MKAIALPIGITISLASAAAAQDRPPPPAAITIPAMTETSRSDSNDDAVTVVAVQVIYKGANVWSDTLTIGNQAGANFNQTKQEYAGPCGGDTDNSRSRRVVDTSLRVSLRSGGYRSASDEVRLSVNYQSAQPGCQNFGSNSVGLERMVTLAPPGKTITIAGEGGLVVRLTRR